MPRNLVWPLPAPAASERSACCPWRRGGGAAGADRHYHSQRTSRRAGAEAKLTLDSQCQNTNFVGGVHKLRSASVAVVAVVHSKMML